MIAQRGSLKVKSLAYPSVVLIDDVMTTGGTLREGIRALEDAGAQQIIAVTLFRVETHDMMSHKD
jgi:predicted amidophosphoribosyltransferase